MLKKLLNLLKIKNMTDAQLKQKAFTIIVNREYKKQSKNNLIPGFLVLEQVKKQAIRTIKTMNKTELQNILKTA